MASGRAVAGAKSAPPLVDRCALHGGRARLLTAPAPPVRHGEVARRMADRLAVVKMQPQTVLDWGARAGGGGARLAAAYPPASVLAVEPDLGGAPGPCSYTPLTPPTKSQGWIPGGPVPLSKKEMR